MECVWILVTLYLITVASQHVVKKAEIILLLCITNARVLACDVDGIMLGMEEKEIAPICSQN